MTNKALYCSVVAAVCGAGVMASCSGPQKEAAAPAMKQVERNAEWLATRYGGWGGPGVRPAPGPMDAVALKDWAPRPSLVITESSFPKTRYPAVDAHAHVLARTPEEVAEWVKTMDEVGIETTIVLTGATGERFDKFVDLYLKPYPGRFQLYCGLERNGIDQPDYPERAARELERCYKMGARGVGELSDKGWGLARGRNTPRSERLHPDDPRLNAFWKKCAELEMPVNLHVADHPSCWTPLDEYQERTPDYQHFSQYGKDVPNFQELIVIRNHTLAKHPDTLFIACHLGNQGHDLNALAKDLETYDNLYLDISARDYEVGRTPRAAARFLTRYRDRVLFGTDMGRQTEMYRAWWRLLESADEFMPGRVWWRYYGLELPAPVLEALYRGNARRILNWEKQQ